jgi:hypothetical protein
VLGALGGGGTAPSGGTLTAPAENLLGVLLGGLGQ